jgi:uncharacterized protein (DUF1778 family)
MMAFTLRLSGEDATLLRHQAALEERSMNDVVALAVRERAVRRDRAETDREAVARLIERHAGTLELLAQ